jgi:hypothetical protein
MLSRNRLKGSPVNPPSTLKSSEWGIWGLSSHGSRHIRKLYHAMNKGKGGSLPCRRLAGMMCLQKTFLHRLVSTLEAPLATAVACRALWSRGGGMHLRGSRLGRVRSRVVVSVIVLGLRRVGVRSRRFGRGLGVGARRRSLRGRRCWSRGRSGGVGILAMIVLGRRRALSTATTRRRTRKDIILST